MAEIQLPCVTQIQETFFLTVLDLQQRRVIRRMESETKGEVD